MEPPSRHLVVVPHTHWDREWYRTHEQFRLRLVRLLDGLLDLLESDPDFRHFTLDGQTIVVDDYLEVRPENRGRLEALIRAGRLLVGPWTVLPDEWLVSGEALIRNLQLGLRRARALGGGMRLGYVPDQFGHVGQMPQIFAGFGFEAALLWRGVGADVDQNRFLWQAPDGTELFSVYLAGGYGNANRLPLEPDALRDRLREEIARFERLAPTPTLLLMNGMDHQPPQPGLPAALAEAVDGMEDVCAEIGTLPGYVERALAEAGQGGDIPRHRGELRSGLRAPLLPGCASTRAPQKRAEFRNDRLLRAYLEPLSAWSAGLGGLADPGLLEFLWRLALENHPHDSVCGCSVDAVHDQMDTRFARVHELATDHLREVIAGFAARVAAPRRGFGRGAGEALAVWNPVGGGPALAEGVVEIAAPCAAGRLRAFHLRGADGRRIPVAAELVGPEEVLFELALPSHAANLILPSLEGEFAAHAVRSVERRRDGDTLHLEVRLSQTPTPFDGAAARRAIEAQLADEEIPKLALVARRPPRVRLSFVDDFPGHGLRVYRLGRGRAAASETGDCEGGRSDQGGQGGVWAQTREWRIEVDAAARVRLVHRASGSEIEDAVRIESEGDRGDEYNFDPVPGAVVVERPEKVRLSVARRGEAGVAVVIDADYRVPEGLTPERDARSDRSVKMGVRLELGLWQGLDRIDARLRVDHAARDHRVRLRWRAPFTACRFAVESAFEIAERPLAPREGDAAGRTPSERPVGSGPQRRFAVLDDGVRALTVANRGLAEVEAVREADGRSALALTLLRAVGWLSRDDLALRPGHAGPPLATPGAQVPGVHEAEVSVSLHPAGEADAIRRAWSFAWPPIPFAVPDGGEGVGDGDRLLDLDNGTLGVSAVVPREDGSVEVRLWNASDRAREASVAWHDRRAHVRETNLDGHENVSNPTLATAGSRLSLRPWQIVTLRVGPSRRTDS